MSIYRIHGKVLSEATQKGVSGLRVEVWDKDPVQDDFLGNDVTDQNGVFSVEFDAGFFKVLCFDREPDLYFKIFCGKRLLTSTESSVIWNLKQPEKSITLFVNQTDDNDTSSMDQLVDKADSFIPSENINAIYEAITKVWPEGKLQQKQLDIVANFDCVAKTIDLLWKDALDSLQGDTFAGNRLLAQLNALVQDTRFAQIDSANPDLRVQSISIEAGFIPNPRLPGFPNLCLFPPFRLPDFYFAIARIIELVPNAPTDLIDIYFGRVQSLVEQLAPLEMVYSAAMRVLDGEPGAGSYFAASFGCLNDTRRTGNRQQIAMSFGSFPPPGFRRPPMIFDLCRAKRAQETANAVGCFSRLQAAPRYEIDDIVNLTKGVSRRGCSDDEIEIQGSNLGRRGRITFGLRIEAVTLSWTDSSIRFTVPAGTRGGDIGICIDSEISACTRFPIVCRLPVESTDHSFEVVQAPEIDSFILTGTTIRPMGTDQYEAEACTDITLNAIARYAEQVVIRDGTGTVVWDSGMGEPRTIDTGEIDTPPVLRELQEDMTLTLEVSNLCGTINRLLELSIYKAIHLTAGARVRAGDSINVTLSISCPSPVGGTFVTFVSSLPGALALPDDLVVIADGETTTTVTLNASAACSETEVSASAPDHRGDSVVILVFDTPVITEIMPLERNACSSFSLDIQGDCFDPELAGNSVYATNGTETRSLSVMNIRFLDSTNRGRNAVLEVNGENLLPGNWELFVESHGLTSARFTAPLVIRPVPAVIHNFSNNPLRVTPCVDNSVELHWEVSHAQRVEISSNGRSVVTRYYGPTCTRRSDTARVTISETTPYRLSAFPIGGGTPVSNSLRVTEEVNVLQAEEVRIWNWTRGRWFPEHTLTIWQQNLTTRERINQGTIQHGEEITIRLAHCNLHRVFAVSHEWVIDYNRSHRTSLNANDPVIVDYPNTHKYTSDVLLGRNDRGLKIYRVDPGG